MTTIAIRELLEMYAEHMRSLGFRPKRYPRIHGLRLPATAEDPPGSHVYMQHALYVIETLPDSSFTEANRRLGFVQGVLWMCGAYSYEQLSRHVDTFEVGQPFCVAAHG